MFQKLKIKYQNTNKKTFWCQVLLIIVMCVISFFMLMPFLWCFSTSLRLPKDSFALPPSFFPTEWRWENYSYVFNAFPVLAVLSEQHRCYCYDFDFSDFLFYISGVCFCKVTVQRKKYNVPLYPFGINVTLSIVCNCSVFYY